MRFAIFYAVFCLLFDQMETNWKYFFGFWGFLGWVADFISGKQIEKKNSEKKFEKKIWNFFTKNFVAFFQYFGRFEASLTNLVTELTSFVIHLHLGKQTFFLLKLLKNVQNIEKTQQKYLKKNIFLKKSHFF